MMLRAATEWVSLSTSMNGIVGLRPRYATVVDSEDSLSTSGCLSCKPGYAVVCSEDRLRRARYGLQSQQHGQLLGSARQFRRGTTMTVASLARVFPGVAQWI